MKTTLAACRHSTTNTARRTYIRQLTGSLRLFATKQLEDIIGAGGGSCLCLKIVLFGLTAGGSSSCKDNVNVARREIGAQIAGKLQSHGRAIL